MYINSNPVRSTVAQQALEFADRIAEHGGAHKWVDGEGGVCSCACSFVHRAWVYADAAFDVLGKEHQVAWCDQDVWCLLEHQCFVLLPFNWCSCASWIEWVERSLLEDRLENQVNLWSILGLSAWLSCWIFDTGVDAHILDDISVHDADRNVVDLYHGRI